MDNKDPKKMITPFEIVNEKINLDPSKGLIDPMAISKDFKPNTEKNPTPFEERLYLILYITVDDEGNEDKSFQFIKGRSNVYEFVKSMAPIMNMYDSLILVEHLPLDEAITVYDFIKHVKQFIPEDSFDIDDYVEGDYINDEQHSHTNQDDLNLWNGALNLDTSSSEPSTETNIEVNDDGEYLV